MVNQHSKSVTKPKSELQPHLALQQDIFQEGRFIPKDCGFHYLSIGASGTFVALRGTEL